MLISIIISFLNLSYLLGTEYLGAGPDKTGILKMFLQLLDMDTKQ